MKKIIFIRHNILEKPFENYSNLTYENIISLSNQSIDPLINNNPFNTDTVNKVNDFNPEIVYVSEQSRTFQTANLLGIGGNIENSANINEIMFSIEKLLSKDEYLNYGLPLIRKRLWTNLFEDKIGVEKIESIEHRLNQFIKNLSEKEHKKICVISHGFLLSIVKKFYNDGEVKISKNIDIKNMPIINYLESFEVELNL